MKKLFLAILIVPFLGTLFFLRAAEAPIGWEISAQNEKGELEYDPETGVITAPSGVSITYSNTVLTAHKITAHQDSGDVLAEGDVLIKGANHIWRGERIQFNFKTMKMESADFKTGRDPLYITGEGLAGEKTNKTYYATNAFFTTDNVPKPAHRIRARRIKIVPGDYVEARNATLFLGKVPVFYWPRYKRSFGRHPNNFVFTPGYRSLQGPFLLSTFNWYWSEKLDGALHLDLRQRRGLAGGPDFNYNLGRFGKGSLQYYFARDLAPEVEGNPLPVDENRQRLKFSHQATLRTNLTAKVVVAYQSDPYIVRDFFEGEYRQNVQPNTFAEVNQLWPNFALDFLAQPRINDFFETVERLPDVKLTAFPQQLGVSPIYYESESSVGYFRRKFSNTNNAQFDFEALRGDSYHQLTLPQTFFGWLNFTPRVGGRFTYYTEANGPGATTSEQTRGVFNTGAEISFKSSRVWRGVESRFWDVNGLRHIIEPSLNYVFVPSPNVLPPQLPQFDYEVPSLRLLPIEYPEYNAIDSIDSQNVIRFTLRNKLQTKRVGGVQNLVNWSLYTDWRLKPRSNQTTFADVFSDLDLRPRSWMAFNSETRFSIADERFRESNHRVTILPNSVYSVTLGHRYLADQFGPDSGHNLIYDSIYYRFNENWAARMSHYFEARDGVMEDQFYTLYRDFRSWTSALTFRYRESRGNRPDDFTFAVSFSLKAFPRFKMGSDSDRPWMLLGS